MCVSVSLASVSLSLSLSLSLFLSLSFFPFSFSYALSLYKNELESPSHFLSPLGCPALGLKIQTGPCSSAPTGLLHAFDSPEKASRGLSASCDDLLRLATPPPTAECCETLSAFGAAGCACDAVTLALAQMALGVDGDGMKALVRGATAACSAVGVSIVDSCGGATC